MQEVLTLLLPAIISVVLLIFLDGFFNILGLVVGFIIGALDG